MPKFEIGEISGDEADEAQLFYDTYCPDCAEHHENAGHIAEYYECPDKYVVTEMEEIGIMNAAECFGLKDRVISLRVIVIDAVLAGEL